VTAGHEVQIENERVRVTRWDLAPNAGTGQHEHLHDYVVVPLVDGRMHVTDVSGTTSVSVVEAGSSYFRPAGAVHNVVNGGDGLLSFVEVELL
jgi:quercetin dioxygenase-like cupin family protein